MERNKVARYKNVILFKLLFVLIKHSKILNNCLWMKKKIYLDFRVFFLPSEGSEFVSFTWRYQTGNESSK